MVKLRTTSQNTISWLAVIQRPKYITLNCDVIGSAWFFCRSVRRLRDHHVTHNQKKNCNLLIRADHPLSAVRVRFPLRPTTLKQLSSQHCAVKRNTVSASVHLLPQDIRPANDLTPSCEVPAWALTPGIIVKCFFVFFFMFSASSSLSSPPLRYSLSYSLFLSLSCFWLLKAVTVLRSSLVASSWIFYDIVK